MFRVLNSSRSWPEDVSVMMEKCLSTWLVPKLAIQR